MKIRFRESDGQVVSAVNSLTGGDFMVAPMDGFGVAELNDNMEVYKNPLHYFYKDGHLVKAVKSRLSIRCDAFDTDGDGVIDIVADGLSHCMIDVQKIGENGHLVEDAFDEIWISASRGSLTKIHGRLLNGRFCFRLTSVSETVISEIKVTARNIHIIDGLLEIQFRP